MGILSFDDRIYAILHIQYNIEQVIKMKGFKNIEKAFGGWGEKKIKNSAYIAKIKKLKHELMELKRKREEQHRDVI